MFRIITVEGQFGSGGEAIAERVAEQLGWKLLEPKAVEAAWAAQVDAEPAGQFDERADSWWRRTTTRGLWSARIKAGASAGDVRFFDAGTMAALVREQIADAAAGGGYVIVGSGAQCELQICSEAFHVFVYAPWTERVTRVRQHSGTNSDIKKVLRKIHDADQARAAFIRRYFRSDWTDPQLYHLMVSSQLGEDHVARLITEAVASPEGAAFLQSSGR